MSYQSSVSWNFTTANCVLSIETVTRLVMDYGVAMLHNTSLTLSGPGYLMSLMVRGGGGTYALPLISKSTNSSLMTLYSTLHKNCSHYRSAICFKIGLGLAEIIRCLCIKVVFLQIIGDYAVAWTSSIEFVACMASENCWA